MIQQLNNRTNLFNRYLTVEIATVLFCFTLPFLQFGIQDLLYQKLCLDYQNNATLCQNKAWIHKHKDIEGQTSLYTMYFNIAVILPSVVVALIMGSYIDRYGFYAPLQLPLSGCVVGFTLIAAIAWVPSMSHNWLFIPMLILGCTGHSPTVILAFMAYAVKDSSKENRSIKLAIVASCLSIAITIGIGVLGPIVESAGLPSIFIISAVACLLAILDIKFRLRKPAASVQDENKKDTWSERLRYTLHLKTMKAYGSVLIKKRNKSRRLHIYLSILVFVVSFCALIGVVDVEFLYLTKEKDFSRTKVSVFMSIGSLLTFIGNILFIYFLNIRLKLNIIWITLLGSLGSTVCYLGLALSTSDTAFWATNVFRITAGLTSVGSRTYISHCVSMDEQGVIMSLLATAEAIFKLIASLVFNGLYDATLEFWPGTTLCLAAILCLLGVPFLIGIRWRDKKLQSEEDFEHLVEDEGTNSVGYDDFPSVNDRKDVFAHTDNNDMTM